MARPRKEETIAPIEYKKTSVDVEAVVVDSRDNMIKLIKVSEILPSFHKYI